MQVSISKFIFLGGGGGGGGGGWGRICWFHFPLQIFPIVIDNVHEYVLYRFIICIDVVIMWGRPELLSQPTPGGQQLLCLGLPLW